MDSKVIILMIFRIITIAYLAARLFVSTELFRPGAWVDFIVMIYVVANLLFITFHEINDPEIHFLGK